MLLSSVIWAFSPKLSIFRCQEPLCNIRFQIQECLCPDFSKRYKLKSHFSKDREGICNWLPLQSSLCSRRRSSVQPNYISITETAFWIPGCKCLISYSGKMFICEFNAICVKIYLTKITILVMKNLENVSCTSIMFQISLFLMHEFRFFLWTR